MVNKSELEYKNISKTIIKRYIPAVILIVILIVIRQLIIQYQINQDSHLSGVVNIAGKQRMLSQRIAKDAYALYINQDKDKISFYANQLKESVDNWKESNIDLKTGNLNQGFKENNSDEIMKLFSEIEGNHQEMINAAYDIVKMIESENYNESLLLDKVNIIENNEGIYLNGMEKIVYQYDKEFQTKLMFLGKTELALFIIILIIIIFEILFIFMPAEKNLSKAFEEIEESHENMLKLFKTAHEAMFVIDEEELKVLLMNKQAEELINRENINDKLINISDIIKCEYAECNSLIEKIKFHEKNENMEFVLNVNGNKDITALISSTKIYFYKKAAILIGLFDITIQKKAEEVLRNIAVTDELTGLYNRHFLDKRINEEIDNSECNNEPLSIVILDLDYFKRINDNWGHPVGDEVLKQTAQIASSVIRKSDILFRLGGEEFLVLMPRTNTKNAAAVAEKIREAIENNPHPTVGHFTASFGVAERNKSESFKSLYKRADEGLYKAKEGGRNRVVSSDIQENLPVALVHFEWKSEWESGNKDIDDQHGKLLEIGNSLIYMLLSNESIEKTNKQLDILLKHLDKHFNYEEEIMKSAGYKDYTNHCKIHKNLVAKAVQMKEAYENGALKSSKFFSFIVDDIIIGHMQNSDMQFFQYLNENI